MEGRRVEINCSCETQSCDVQAQAAVAATGDRPDRPDAWGDALGDAEEGGPAVPGEGRSSSDAATFCKIVLSQCWS